MNTLSPGDRVLIFETGSFLARRVAADRRTARPAAWTTCRATGAAARRQQSSKRACSDDTAHAIKAVVVVHNETSTGVDEPDRAIFGAR